MIKTMRIVGAASVLMWMLQGIASAELVGYWPLDEGSGDTTADMSPSGTTGVISNGATGGLGEGGSVWVNDPVRGTVLGFNGAADSAYVQAGSIPTMTLDNDYTWSFWANHSPDNNQPNNIVLGNRKDANGDDFTPRQFIKFTPTKFEWHTEGNGDDNLDYPDFADVAGEWHHHTVVKSGADLSYYLNGTPTSAGVITQPFLEPQPLFFGGDNQGADGENWQGMIDDIRIYNHALGAGEVASLVPEPSSAVLLLSGMVLFCLRQRRR